MTAAAPSRRQRAAWRIWGLVAVLGVIAACVSAAVAFLCLFGAITNQVGQLTRADCWAAVAIFTPGAIASLLVVIGAGERSGPPRRGS